MNKEIEYYGILDENGIKEFISLEGIEKPKRNTEAFTMSIRSNKANGLLFMATLNGCDGDEIIEIVKNQKVSLENVLISSNKTMEFLMKRAIKIKMSYYGLDLNVVIKRWKDIKESILNTSF